MIGGYRVVRRLGAGSHADVWLGRSEEHTALAALKVFRPDADVDGVDNEIRALSRMRSPHIITILDTANDGDGRPCLVMPRLDPGGLAHLLASRAQLSAGEVVTLMVPIAQAVAQMHAAAVSHGALRAAKVLFDDEGAPVLLGASTLRLEEPGARPATSAGQQTEPRFEVDRRQLGSLATGLIRRVDGAPLAFPALSAWLEGSPWLEPKFTDELIARLWDSADALPLGLPWLHGDVDWADLAADAHGAPRLRHGEQPSSSVERGTGANPSPRRPGRRPSRLFPADRLTEAATGLRRRVTRIVASVRPRYRILAAVCCALLLSTIALAGLQPKAGASAGDRVAPGAESLEVGTESLEVSAEDGSPVHPIPSGPATEQHSELVGDDPVAAARVLLASREECYRTESIECLVAVVQEHSASWATDTSHIAGLRDGTRSHAAFWREELTVAVVDVMGAVVLLSISPPPEEMDEGMQPASVLIIRTEAGWRIRDVFAD